ncbi:MULTISPECIES: O-antigen ligase family protein [unclassified Undibacterium]|uniref:O-antigen ligase family protein n=1 Tax=unclassified Undibacterium TaxID=2630295 RepID=UPI002AC90C4D|nr:MULTISPECIES: O-antigen ligase family protein [unclassified Undibacterium]MEB0138468.1 O-antigen ligase family protein [Undibacterium sp. CCC2.1]MEB0173132.1 O-antigen ligase family protein [Undibacterium sp. CCC1.1]MEB0177522.1 O-antigen ligase family protein [Undibacterium sp. CCC3.4]MEB0216162.1 O-antigen ligase family protein [Undibacterium sp. 5I2]WPX42789.1 O-antigen ligase family protein [Undibacterium sp. CCC3.4]
MKILSTQQQAPALPAVEIHLIQAMVMLFAIFSLLPYGISWDYAGTSALTMEGSLTTKLEWGSLILVALYVLYRNLPVARQDLRAINPFLLLVLLWCLLSSLWSPLAGVSFKRAIQLYGIVLIGLSIQLAPQPLHLIVTALLRVLMGMLLLSLVMALAFPSIGIDYELGNAWRGALSQKNELGQVAAMALLLWQVKACMERIDSKFLGAALLFSFFMLIMSKSSTSLLIALSTSAVFHLFRKRRLSSDYSLTRILLSLLCLILLMLYAFYLQESRFPTWPEVSAPIASLFGKGSDLTGRTDIWNLVWLEIHRHWVIGLGYGAFWLGPDSLSQYVISALNWIPLQSHNGYLDILNEQGLIGLGGTVLVLLTQARQLAIMAHGDRLQAAFWSAMLLVVVVTNFTESSLFRGFGFQNVFFIFALVASTCVNRRLSAANADPEPTQVVRPSGRINRPAAARPRA